MLEGKSETEVRKGRNEAIDEKRQHEKDKWAGILCCDVLKKIGEIWSPIQVALKLKSGKNLSTNLSSLDNKNFKEKK